MSLIILAIIVLIVAGLAIYAVDAIPVPAPMNGPIKALIVVLAILVILSRSGLL